MTANGPYIESLETLLNVCWGVVSDEDWSNIPDHEKLTLAAKIRMRFRTLKRKVESQKSRIAHLNILKDHLLTECYHLQKGVFGKKFKINPGAFIPDRDLFYMAAIELADRVVEVDAPWSDRYKAVILSPDSIDFYNQYQTAKEVYQKSKKKEEARDVLYGDSKTK